MTFRTGRFARPVLADTGEPASSTEPNSENAPAASTTDQGGSRTSTFGTGVSVGGCLGLVVVIAILGLLAAITLPPLVEAPGARRSATCQNRLKQMGLVFKFYASENPELAFPPLSTTQSKMMMDAGEVYPEYHTDGTILLCPEDDTLKTLEKEENINLLVDDHSYFYLGYVLTNEQEGLAFLEMYRADFEAMGGFEGDIPAPEGLGSGGGSTFLRLREGLDIERDLVPVMVENPGHHEGPGGNVLYMDGHVEFVEYPGKFPMTPAFIEALRDAAGREAAA